MDAAASSLGFRLIRSDNTSDKRTCKVRQTGATDYEVVGELEGMKPGKTARRGTAHDDIKLLGAPIIQAKAFVPQPTTQRISYFDEG